MRAWGRNDKAAAKANVYGREHVQFWLQQFLGMQVFLQITIEVNLAALCTLNNSIFLSKINLKIMINNHSRHQLRRKEVYQETPCVLFCCVCENFLHKDSKLFTFEVFFCFFNREILGFSGLLFSFLWFEFFSDADAEVIALSSKSLLATNRFVCEICNKGFQRDQNLQLHRRGHGLPWKLKQRAQPYPASFFWQHEIRHQRRKKKLTAWKTERFHNQRKTNNFYSMQLNIPSVSLLLPSLCCCQWWYSGIKLNFLALQWKERPNFRQSSKSRWYTIQIFTHKSAHSLSGTRNFQTCKI